MKLNKTIGRVATTLVATAMLASLAAVPAFAANATQGSKNTPLESLKINKVLQLPSDVATPNAYFDFTVTGASVTPGANITVDSQVLDLYAGVGSITTSGVNISPDDDATHRTANTPSTGMDTVEYEVEFVLPDNTDFKAAGVYKYEIDETEPNTTDYIEKTQQLDLYLIVEREYKDTAVSANDTYIVTGAYIYPHGDQMTDTSKKTADYISYYKLKEDGSRKVGDLEFTKTVKGAMANMSDTFTFTVSGAGIITGTDYTVKIGSAEKTKLEATAAGLVFNNVGNGADIIIYGIDAGDYTVVESDTENKGYSVSTSNADKDGELDDATATVAVPENGSVKVDFTNTRDAVTPTGIVMNVAPYALLVVIAVAGCFVFLRKRRED